MHDPMTVAFEIRRPWRDRPSRGFPKGYRPSLVTIWHCDPESDGSDDSCGWFMRSRHGDESVLAKIRKDFEFNWDASYGGWFDPDGKPLMSTSGIVVGMFHVAALHQLGSRRSKKFLRNRLFDILHFAENPIDSMHPSIVGKYGIERRDERISQAAAIIYGCVLRWTRPWYRHPRWHVWHWRIQIHPWQQFRRWLLTRCARCGKGFRYGESPVSHSWRSPKKRWFRGEVGLYHADCSRMDQAAAATPSNLDR